MDRILQKYIKKHSECTKFTAFSRKNSYIHSTLRCFLIQICNLESASLPIDKQSKSRPQNVKTDKGIISFSWLFQQRYYANGFVPPIWCTSSHTDSGSQKCFAGTSAMVPWFSDYMLHLKRCFPAMMKPKGIRLKSPHPEGIQLFHEPRQRWHGCCLKLAYPATWPWATSPCKWRFYF